MSTHDSDNSSPDRGTAAQQRVYACVCGADVELGESDSAATCPRCQRSIMPAGLTSASMSIGATIIGDIGDPSTDTLPVQPGDHLDHFAVTDLLGVGGMGAVFRGRDESLQRFVAIKVIRGGKENAVRRERIIQEARAQARVSHNHVVHIYFVGMHHECPFFAMELVNGKTLAEYVRHRRLTFSEIVRIGLETADALGHSAMLGVIHGDVKPGNILLDDTLAVKLSDFGLAGISSDGDVEQSSTGPAGTLNYMAPEVAGGQLPDVRSDMYSLGVMLYELTFGELPHGPSSDSLEESLKQRQVADVRFPWTMPEDRPEGWADFLKRLLNRDRRQRFESWDEVQKELSHWQSSAAPPAGRIIRGVAWLMDMGCVGLGAAFTGLLDILPRIVRGLGGESGGGPLLCLVPVFLTWLHLRWGTSAGKKLLHLQITDKFGLRPSRRKLLCKSIGTYLPIWVAACNQLFEFLWAVGSSRAAIPSMIEWFWVGVLAASFAFMVVNGVWLLFSKKRHSLVDKLLRVQVTRDVN